MDYKEKYNELVESIKKLQEANPSDEGIQNWVNDNVPELKESEDERIRKFIIHLLNNHISNHVSRKDIKECIDWLEKQGEQKSAWSEEDELRINSSIEHLQSTIDDIPKCYIPKEIVADIDWLKSLKQRIGR